MSPRSSPPFDLDALQRETFVERIEYCQEVDSTNDLALQLSAGKEVTTPLLALAERQTNGRGRGANQWWAADGALTFSLLLDSHALNLAMRNWPKVSLTTGLAICQVLGQAASGCEIRLKWPNDVFLQSRKVSGVLVESAPTRSEMIVIGIGMNVNNSLVNAPDELQATATSLVDVTGRSLDRTALLVQLLQELDTQLADVGNAARGLADRWREFCMLEGRTLQIDSVSGSVVGVCQGIDEEGALLLQTETELVRCFSGVVAHVD